MIDVRLFAGVDAFNQIVSTDCSSRLTNLHIDSQACAVQVLWNCGPLRLYMGWSIPYTWSMQVCFELLPLRVVATDERRDSSSSVSVETQSYSPVRINELPIIIMIIIFVIVAIAVKKWQRSIGRLTYSFIHSAIHHHHFRLRRSRTSSMQKHGNHNSRYLV